VHGNVVEASWLALVDALTFASMRQRAPLTAVR
jgi:2-isopropylmalate synthase